MQVILERHYGKESPDVATVMLNKADVLQKLGRKQESRVAYEWAQVIFKRVKSVNRRVVDAIASQLQKVQ